MFVSVRLSVSLFVCLFVCFPLPVLRDTSSNSNRVGLAPHLVSQTTNMDIPKLSLIPSSLMIPINDLSFNNKVLGSGGCGSGHGQQMSTLGTPCFCLFVCLFVYLYPLVLQASLESCTRRLTGTKLLR